LFICSPEIFNKPLYVKLLQEQQTRNRKKRMKYPG